MAETAKPKPRRKTSQRKTTAKPAAKSRTTSGKTKAAANPPAEETAKEAVTETADAAPAADGEHVKITPPEPRRGSGGAWFLVLLLIIVSVGAGYLTWPRWQPYVEAYIPERFAVALEDPRVEGLGARVDKLETQAEALRQKDEVIAKLEDERQKLSESLAGVLERIESIEHSIVAVQEMARAAATAEEAAAASRSLKALNERLSKVETQPTGGGEAAPEISSRIAKLEQDRSIARDLANRIAQLEQAGARSRKDLSDTLSKLNDSRTSLSALEGRISAVEQRPAAGSAPSSALVLAVSELRDAVHRGRAYTAEIDAVRAAAGDDPAVKAALVILEKHAAKGIGTLSELRDAFAALAGDVTSASDTSSESGWIDRAMNRLSSLVRLRRIDGAGEPASTESLVSQAEKHLASGDLTAAAGAVEKLDGAARKAAAAWLVRAKARLAAEQSLASLHALAVSMLSAPKG